MDKQLNLNEAKTLPKQYNPGIVESKWQNFWLRKDIYANVFQFDKKDVKRPSFIIDTPPPFTSGELHIGHAYWNTLNDTLARYKRMRGFNVLLPQGWDCQGLPTELKVQKRWNIPKDNRELFRQKCIDWTQQMIVSMKNTMIKLGYRPDWEQFEYRTMDPYYWRNVQSTLLTFYEKKLIYRDAFPIHWCPNCETALAQAELGYIDMKGYLFYIKFRCEESYIEVATTRPELLSACQALAINPNDEKNKKLITKKAVIPLFERSIPILSDSNVDLKFGSGIVMICTFGDEQDIRWQQKHNLPISEVVNEKGCLINSGKFNGLNILDARRKVVFDLKKLGLISHEEEINHKVLCHTERSDCMFPIEFLIRKQFFIKIKPFKETLINTCQGLKWLPDYMLQRFIDWVNSIEWDWLISRQRIYGTPLPFWFCESCNEIIPANEKNLPMDPTKEKPPVEVCPKCGSKKIKASDDVCDCWVDSSITPLIISGYFDDKVLFKRSYPITVREQGHDIIRTWLFYTVFRCLILTAEPPFREILINGHVLGPDGYRMSKSRGNVINPEEKLIEYGADSIRQTLLSFTLGSDFPFKWEAVKYSKGFLQKYWSASRFAHQFIFGYKPSIIDIEHLTTIDKWILTKLVEMTNSVTEAFDKYQFHTALEAIQKFIWHDFCDQYLEAIKYRLYNKVNQENSVAAKYTIYTVLLNSTKILSPICPHITEEIYQILFNDIESIHAAKWPKIEELPFDIDAKEEGNIIMETISALRNEKAKAGIPLNALTAKIIIRSPKHNLSTLRKFDNEIKQILHINETMYEEGEDLKISILK